jgi:hypothetical protein
MIRKAIGESRTLCCGRLLIFKSVLQFIGRAPPTRSGLAQYPERSQFTDISQRGVRRTLRNRRPLAAGQFAFESIKETIKQFGLTLIQRRGGPTLPETRLGEHGVEGMLGTVHCAVERVEEPGEPGRHVERPFLRLFDDVVVVLALSLNLRRQALEAVRTSICACEQQVA